MNFSLLRKILNIICVNICVLFSIIFFLKSLTSANTILFFDDFEINRQFWNEITHPNGYWQIINGEYQGTAYYNSLLMPLVATGGDSNWENYIFKAKIKGEEGVDRGVVFRVNNDGKYYGINIVGDYPDPNWANKIEIFKGNTIGNFIGKETLSWISYENISEQIYELKIKVVNSNNAVKITIYIDNSIITEYVEHENDNPIYYGKIGLLIWPGGAGVSTPQGIRTTVQYDDVTVEPYITDPTPSNNVILIPGMGASWNADAILNCKLTGYSDEWVMAPYTEGIYSPLISHLETEGFITSTYFYDWRIPILQNGLLLSKYINEPTNLVGHSMGGLVGRSYLEQNIGEDNMVEKYISVGSPHRGTALAYPAWFGGDIWNDNFTAKIATTLLIKRCGGIKQNDREVIQEFIPSLKDLLPIDPFLFDRKTNTYLSITENEWLINSTFPTNIDSIIGTLSGYGFDTLKYIKVKKPNKRDEILGNWEYGKPAGKEFTIGGDGTILKSSSRLEYPDIQNFEINQSHSGLISSEEGISTIINFLKSESLQNQITTQPYTNPESALVIISYPSSFWVSDTKGKIIKDKSNIVSFINPNSGRYKLSIIPNSDNTLLLVGQFLKNGQYSWKEFQLKGRLPKFKIMDFDSNNLQENIF